MEYFAGIDIGTSGVKVVLVDERQRLVESHSLPVVTLIPQRGWSEQHPNDWWHLVCSALWRVKAKRPAEFKSITGVGVTGQMHGMVILGKNYEPLCSAVLWNDGRAVEQAKELSQFRPELSGICGVLPMAGLTAPKVLWLKENRPEIFSEICYLVSPKDYINYKLTGRLVTDFSDAAGTWLLDQQKRCWAVDALELVGLKKNQLPEIVESVDVIGCIVPDAVEESGLAATCLVVGGGGDTPVGAVGMGCVKAGSAEISLGTSAHLLLCTDRYQTATEQLIHSFCHAVPGLWYKMAAMLNGASCLSWFSSVANRPVEDLVNEVELNYSGPGNMFFLPYLSGERTPHNNPDARGMFFGLSAGEGSVSMAQAVLEGVAYSLADGYNCLEQARADIDQLILTGGGSKSDLWAQMIADVLNKKIIRYADKAAGPAFGAARLAMIGAGHASYDDFIAHDIDGVDICVPQPRYVEQYQLGWQKFRRLYRSVEQEF